MRRRGFIILLGSAVTAWPLAARAQQAAIPVVGFLHAGTPSAFASLVTAFHEGLDTAGYVEGRSVAIEYRWAENHYERLPALLRIVHQAKKEDCNAQSLFCCDLSFGFQSGRPC